MQRKHSLVIAFLLLILLPRCALLERAERYNFHYLSEHKLQEIEEDLLYAPPALLPPRCLYLYDERGKYTATLTAIINEAEAKEQTPEISRLLERAYKLQGRLCDSLPPREQLYHIAQATQGERYHRLQAVRLLLFAEGTDLQCSSPTLLSLWKELAYHPKERWLADYFLYIQDQTRSPKLLQRLKEATKAPEQVALLALAEAQKEPTPNRISEAWKLIEQLPQEQATTLYATEVIRPLLLQATLYPQALAAHLRLPLEKQSTHPYVLLSEHQAEIALLQRYESAQSELSTTPTELPQPSDFRARWGNISNVDNWSMLHSTTPLGTSRNPLGASALSPIPSQEEYQRVKAYLNELFSLK